MQIFENEDYSIDLEDAGALYIRSKANKAMAVVMPIAGGLMVTGGGQTSMHDVIEALSRRHELLILDRNILFEAAEL